MTEVKRNRYIEKKIRLRPDENNYIKNKMDNAGRSNFTSSIIITPFHYLYFLYSDWIDW